MPSKTFRERVLERKVQRLEGEIYELKEFKERVQLGSRWLLCAVYTLGGIVATAAAFLSAINNWFTIRGH